MRNYPKKLIIAVLAVFLINTASLYTVKTYAVNKKNPVKTQTINKKNTAKTNTESKKNSVEIAKKLLNVGKTKEAETLLNSEIKLNSKNAEAYKLLAKIYIDKNQLPKAKIALNKAFKLQPEDSELFLLTSKLMFKHSQSDQAEKAARRAIALNPDESEAYLILGKVYQNKAAKVDSSDPDKIKYYRNESLRYFKLSARYNSASPESHIGLVKTYMALNQADKAYDELLIAEELGFNNPDTLYAVGESYYKLGKYDKSIKFLQKPAIYNSRKYYDSHFILANIYEKLSDFDNAKKEYLATLKYNPKYTEAKVRYMQLKESEEIASRLEGNMIPVRNEQIKSIKELNTMADYYLIMDKLTQARELYLKVLLTNPNDLRARVGLCELYYSELLLGYLNSNEYSKDRKFVEDDLGITKLVIPSEKAKIAAAQEISGVIRKELMIIENNPDQSPESLLNASRAAFLLGDFRLSNKILNSLALPKMSDYEKFEAAKSLYFDHNYHYSRVIFKSLRSNYPNEVLDTFLTKIDEKYKQAENNISEGQELYKKKDYEAALYKYRRVMIDIPTYKAAYVNYAYTLEQLDDTKNAVKYLDMYSDLEDIYPAEIPILYYKEILKLKSEWQNPRKAKKFKKKNELP